MVFLVVPQTAKAIVSSNVGVLEIKCPWKHRNHTIAEIMKEEVEEKKGNSFYLNLDGTLNENHTYWHQVQGEMISSNATWAHFVIWTTKELKVSMLVKAHHGLRLTFQN